MSLFIRWERSCPDPGCGRDRYTHASAAVIVAPVRSAKWPESHACVQSCSAPPSRPSNPARPSTGCSSTRPGTRSACVSSAETRSPLAPLTRLSGRGRARRHRPGSRADTPTCGCAEPLVSGTQRERPRFSVPKDTPGVRPFERSPCWIGGCATWWRDRDRCAAGPAPDAPGAAAALGQGEDDGGCGRVDRPLHDEPWGATL